MAVYDMLDNCQPQTCASNRTRPVAINPIKPFRKARYMQRINPGTRVTNTDTYGGSPQCCIMVNQLNTKGNLAIGAPIFNGVLQQVIELSLIHI